MDRHLHVFVRIDVAELRNPIAMAGSNCGGEVGYFEGVDDAPDLMRQLAQRIVGKHGRARVCHEARPTNPSLHRLITGAGYP